MSTIDRVHEAMAAHYAGEPHMASAADLAAALYELLPEDAVRAALEEPAPPHGHADGGDWYPCDDAHPREVHP